MYKPYKMYTDYSMYKDYTMYTDYTIYKEYTMSTDYTIYTNYTNVQTVQNVFCEKTHAIVFWPALSATNGSYDGRFVALCT